MKRVPLVRPTTICVLCSLGILCGSAFPALAQQKETITALPGADDTLRIVNTGVQENCASRFACQVSLAGDVITVMERDTVTEKMRCMCTYVLQAQIAGLPPGSYRVDVFREYLVQYGYPSDTTVFIGSVPVVWSHPAGASVAGALRQSACINAGTEGVRAPRSAFSVAPNPARGEGALFYDVRGPGTVTFVVTDMLGREVTRFSRSHAQAESAVVALPPALFERGGAYTVLMNSDGMLRSRRFSVLR